MRTIHLQEDISVKQYQMAVRVLEAIGVKVLKETKKEIKDDTEMTKEAFFAKIDRARESKSHKISREEMRKMLLG
ncbi:MAG: hypothetical protein Q4G08_06230 [Capnocytophaga sp.]|nr:hypothetical protein [Capnocytophaga sp.]